MSKESGSASVVAVKVESVSGFDVLVSSLSVVVKFAL
jgi:FlaG/FlaF family flagellin (archaellin)